MYSDIPKQGKISVIEAHTELDKNTVMENYMLVPKSWQLSTLIITM